MKNKLFFYDQLNVRKESDFYFPGGEFLSTGNRKIGFLDYVGGMS